MIRGQRGRLIVVDDVGSMPPEVAARIVANAERDADALWREIAFGEPAPRDVHERITGTRRVDA